MIELVNQRTKLEKWAAEYLDENSDIMDDVNSDHPVFKMYNTKMKEYESIVDEIRKVMYVRNR